MCIAEGEILTNPKRIKRFSREQYFKTSRWRSLFRRYPSAWPTRWRSPGAAASSLVLGKPQLPDFPTPLVDGTPMPMADYFRQPALAGAGGAAGASVPRRRATRAGNARATSERLEFEIATILKMGFPGYFLIVADFINWAKNNGCPVGPGRGSSAGSLVAYALKITDLDPLRYQPAVRALPEPGACVDARLRRRLLPGLTATASSTMSRQKYGRDAVSQIAAPSAPWPPRPPSATSAV